MIAGKSCWAVVVAAGRSRRMGQGVNKVFCELDGKSVLAKSVEAIEKCGLIDGIVVVVAEMDLPHYDAMCREEGVSKLVKRVVTGGDTRQRSVRNGLLALPEGVDIVAIHDAARALVPESVVRATIESALECGSGVAATEVVDTIKIADDMNRAVETLDRSKLRAVQTPQVFDARDIIKSHELAENDGFTATDDAALYERYIAKPRLVVTPGGEHNRKLTTMEDLTIMRGELSQDTRVGFGFDAHRLVLGRKLVLCGVEVPYDRGLEGHSDADCATHALMDALLSAAGLGDIGRMFPDDDDEYKDIYSIELLKKVMAELVKLGASVVNADVTIIAQAPKLAGYMDEMRLCLADAMSLDAARVNVKATTTERMGYEGRGEGISACAVALVRFKM